MVKSQLVELLRTFNKKEIRECKKWLNSPFHNQRQDVIDLFEYFFGKKNIYTDEKLHKEKIFAIIFSNETFDDARIRQTMYFLLKAVESYLVFRENRKNDLMDQLTLAQVYREKQLNKAAQKTLSNSESKFKKNDHKNSNYYWKIYDYEQEAYKQYSTIKGNRYLHQQLQKLADRLDEAYIIEQLRLACLRLSTIKHSKDEIHLTLIETFLKDNSKEFRYKDSPGVSLYYALFKLLSNPSDEYFNILKKQVINNIHLFLPTEIREILLIIINYCVRRGNSGERRYLAEAFYFHKISIENNAFLQDGILNRNLFKNIVSIGNILGEFTWVDNFIHDYQKYIDEEHRENYTTFCLAQLHYYKKEYKKAMLYLAAYEYDDILLNLNSKGMLTKMYYELDELNTLEALLESTKVYLRRKEGITDSYRSVYNNFIKYTQKLLRVNPYDREKKAKLREEIQAANPLIEKQWFLERLEQL